MRADRRASPLARSTRCMAGGWPPFTTIRIIPRFDGGCRNVVAVSEDIPYDTCQRRTKKSFAENSRKLINEDAFLSRHKFTIGSKPRDFRLVA